MAPGANTPNNLTARAAVGGAVAANLAAPLAAAVVAILYRFPAPLAGYVCGLSGAVTASFASLFYLLLGGALVLAVLGALGGVAAARIAAPDAGRVARLTLSTALTAALLGAIALATLEWFVGAW
ncbi:hypothetical protein [Nocardia sp. NPDC050406]|uniref:hypothetical protein n=1 Tax=Nocardia sp. NPDC050406 TaxID=3364318 RepID=UPI0037B63C58